jgi:hypothetical protein
MKSQMEDLFEHASRYPEAPGFVKGSDTSREAAARVEGSAASMRAKVVAFIKARPEGATCDEVEAGLDMRHQTASARVREAFVADQLMITPDRRPTRSGSFARVYKYKEREQ